MSVLDYRAWHKKRKKMYEVLHLHMETEPWVTAKGFDIINQKDIHVDIQPNDCVIMKCAGLKDSKGNKIYEGDVMKLNESSGEVVFHKGQYQVNTKPKYAGDQWRTALYDAVLDGFVVIGNKYATPELLEV
ncbi:putative phage protein (TIGR01671 family) [Paenibacillus turicensis]|uniref:Phage protein (TIGR01671 family) n=1 Tax=Paenibacillus turicensis TaxID=160487 RepID=A0ABS4FRV9_9BACL|nr:YopX family protein [Paenibacillus turicensis]MBP1905310.1 putative phage protein (TIGR01671 family) [Paenibacillus turicensis]